MNRVDEIKSLVMDAISGFSNEHNVVIPAHKITELALALINSNLNIDEVKKQIDEIIKGFEDKIKLVEETSGQTKGSSYTLRNGPSTYSVEPNGFVSVAFMCFMLVSITIIAMGIASTFLLM